LAWASAAAGLAIASTASAGVRTFDGLNWVPSGGSGSVYIAINNLATGPISSATALTGWDMQIESSNSGNVLKFTFPPSGPSTPSDPNPRYGLMRLPGTSSGGGASLAFGTLVEPSASFADSGPVTFGGGAGQWRLNSENYFGFRFALGSSTSIHFGYGRIFIGSTPGQFRLLSLAYEDFAGAPLVIVPGPGVAVTMVAVATIGRRRRSR
jgi:hypothetical protein